jgi:hypothetical protein
MMLPLVRYGTYTISISSVIKESSQSLRPFPSKPRGRKGTVNHRVKRLEENSDTASVTIRFLLLSTCTLTTYGKKKKESISLFPGCTPLQSGPYGKGIHGLPKVSCGPAMPTLICPAGGPHPKRPYGRLGGGPPAVRATCGRLLPP